MKCTIMNKNIPLLEVNIDNSYQITDIYKKKNPEYLPLLFYNQKKYINNEDIFLKDLNEWFKGRIIPRKREYYQNILNYINKESIIPFGFHFAGLSDQYWIKYGYEKWEDVNFFLNDYSADLGNLFFQPYLVDPKYHNLNSPDLTTGGFLRKKWVKTSDGIWLIKAGSCRLRQDAANEVIASVIAERLNYIPVTKYSLCLEGTELCSKCKNFIDESTELVPAYHLFNALSRKEGHTVYQHLLRCMEFFQIKDGVEYIDSMIMIDFLVQNKDRHLNNFGFIRDLNTGKITGFAPLFDFGNAMQNNGYKKENKKIFKDREKEALEKIDISSDLYKKIEKDVNQKIEKYKKLSEKEHLKKAQEILKYIKPEERDMEFEKF